VLHMIDRSGKQTIEQDYAQQLLLVKHSMESRHGVNVPAGSHMWLAKGAALLCCADGRELLSTTPLASCGCPCKV